MRRPPADSNPTTSSTCVRRTIAAALLGALVGLSSVPAVAEPREVVLQVSGLRAPCVGVAPMMCLQVRRGEHATGDWQNFYAGIEGFEHQPGYRYLIRVRETPLPPGQVPADASSIRYELVEVLDQAPDPVVGLHDIFVLRRIEDSEVDTFDPATRMAQPYIEFHVARGDYLGNDGCGAFHGDLLAAEPRRLWLGPVQGDGSERACRDGPLQERFRAALERVAGWQRDDRGLGLFDADGVEILRFNKVD